MLSINVVALTSSTRLAAPTLSVANDSTNDTTELVSALPSLLLPSRVRARTSAANADRNHPLDQDVGQRPGVSLDD